MNKIEELRRVELRGSKETFHRAVFDYLLALWEGKTPPPQVAECTELLPILARWLRAAPLKEPHDRFRILTARKSILCLIHAAGSEVDAFLESTLGSLPPMEQAAPWMRQKLSLMASIDSRWMPDLVAWHRISPGEAMIYVIAGLQDEPISVAGLDHFNTLTRILPELAPADLPYAYLADLTYASYIVGFATDKRKYDSKRVLGNQVRRMLEKRGFLIEMPNPATTETPVRPRVVVIAEKIIDGNMMHRCYGQQIEEMKRDFEVTLVAETPSRCPAHAKIAHHVRYFDPHPEKLGDLIRLVLNIAPNVIYFPSVSMTPSTFALSHLRLAPTQIASLGHPCPTASPVIDYQAMQREIWSPDGSIFEPPLLHDSHALSADFCFSDEVQSLHEAWVTRAPRDRLRVAINASSMKLNAEFLAAIKGISDACNGRLQLRFFPSSVGVRHLSLTQRLHAWFPDAEIMEGTNFKRYLELLADCDMALQAFPFGGTNTTIDSLALGLPIICMDGPEIHSRIDATILDRVGLAPNLLAKSEDDYREIALRLIGDATERLRIGRQARLGVLAMLRAPAAGSTFADALKSAIVTTRRS